MHSSNILLLGCFSGAAEKGVEFHSLGVSLTSSLGVARRNMLAYEYHATLKRKKLRTFHQCSHNFPTFFFHLHQWQMIFICKTQILRNTHPDSCNSILFPPAQESILDTSDQEWSCHWNTFESAVILLRVNNLQTLVLPNE